MFFFIPVIIIISLIRLAIDVKPAFLVSPYSNSGMALTIVFGVGPFVVALGSYLSQLFASKDTLRYASYQRFGSLLPYLVFVSLIYPQSFGVLMADGSVDVKGGGWLYSALASLTENFELLRPSVDLIDPSSSSLAYDMHNYLHKFLMIFAYYGVFYLYLIVCDSFSKKGSKDFHSHLPVAFMSTLRQGLFGVVFVFIFIFAESFESVSKGYVSSVGFSSTSVVVKLAVAFLDAGFFLLTPLLFIYFLPLILPKIAGWKVLPKGEYLDLLEQVSSQNQFKYNKIYLAQKPGLITAGIIGYFPSTRNLVFTQDLLHLLQIKEIEAVMLHEIGHARYKHIFTYYLFFLGLIFLTSISLVAMHFIPGVSLLDGMTLSVISYLIIIIGIRYGWGWLSRQCERQADLYAAEVQKTPEHLVSSFYKISDILGDVLDKPSWHHGTLRTRIGNLENAFVPGSDSPPEKHHRFVSKIRTYILLFFVAFFSLTIYQTYDSYSNPLGRLMYLSNEISDNFKTKNYESAISNSEKLLANLDALEDMDDLKHREIQNDKQIVYYNLACAYSVVGDTEKAFVQLFALIPMLTKELVVDSRIENLNSHKFKTDEDLNSIKEDIRFAELLEMVQGIEEAFKNGKPNPYAGKIE